MRNVTVSRMRERYAQTVLTYRITYIYEVHKYNVGEIQTLEFVNPLGENQALVC